MREQLPSPVVVAGARLARSARSVVRQLLMKRRRLFVVVLTTFCILNGSARLAHGAEYEADAVKAAFLHRFAAYVEWPNQAANDAPFTIAILDDERLVTHLQRLLPGLAIKNRRPQVRSISGPGELDGVQVVYISAPHAARIKALVNEVKGRPILIVTDHVDGLEHGGIINFVQVGRNVRFEVSLPAARRNGLQINAGLLSVAVRVEDEPRSNLEDESPHLLVARNPVSFWRSQSELRRAERTRTLPLAHVDDTRE